MLHIKCQVFECRPSEVIRVDGTDGVYTGFHAGQIP